jgi:hypothetical protein
MEKIGVLLSQVDDAIAQDKAAADESVNFTPEVLTEIADELRQSLSELPDPKNKEAMKAVGEKKKQVRQKEQMRDKLCEYDTHLDTMGERNSYSKTDLTRPSCA